MEVNGVGGGGGGGRRVVISNRVQPPEAQPFWKPARRNQGQHHSCGKQCLGCQQGNNVMLEHPPALVLQIFSFSEMLLSSSPIVLSDQKSPVRPCLVSGTALHRLTHTSEGNGVVNFCFILLIYLFSHFRVEKYLLSKTHSLGCQLDGPQSPRKIISTREALFLIPEVPDPHSSALEVQHVL